MKLRIAEFRKLNGYSQRDLAEKLGKSFRTIQKWENGETFPPADALCAICEILKTDPNTLMGWYESHPSESQTLAPDERELIENYRRSGNQAKMSLSFMSSIAADAEKKTERPGSYEGEVGA